MADNAIDIERLAPQVRDGIRILPTVHARIDMASAVHCLLMEHDPSAIAVEIPTTLRDSTLRAIKRLPKVSVIISEEEGEDALVWAVTPGDPFVVAIRWALNRGRRFFFVDPDIRYLARHSEVLPDPHAMWVVGPEIYLDLVKQAASQTPSTTADEMREAGMAYHVDQAYSQLKNDCESPTLFVLLGAAHADSVGERLNGPLAQPLARTRRSHVELRHLHPSSMTGMFEDPPVAHAALEVLIGDGNELELCPSLHQTLSTKVALRKHGLQVISDQSADDQVLRRKRIARYVAEHAARKIGGCTIVDRSALGGPVWDIGAGSYTAQTEESLRRWQKRIFFDFTRRYVKLQGMLVPNTYEWVVAGRGVADDNLAWELFDVARTYPWQTEQAEIPTARIDSDMLDLGTRKVRFRRRFFRVKQRLISVPVRNRPQVDDPADWLKGFQADDGSVPGLCSHQPEDLVIEDYGRFLQAKAISLISAEHRQSEPFSSSFLDGLDIRETMRNVHESRIYVQEFRRVPGSAGSVVVIFDRDPDGERFPYCLTWLGEHQDESDMAFYSTVPAHQVVGPGITRATYGGFMLTMPPGRLFDVWRDADYWVAQEKAEVLTMAAIDYSKGKFVVHVAKDPPKERMRRYAATQKKRLVHIPLGSLSPVTLRKIRVVHLLAGHDKRLIAKDYIW